MDGLETAIRNALERSGTPDRTQRQRVYQSARSALEKSLARQEGGDGAAADAQRDRIEAVIVAIENEYAERDMADGLEDDGLADDGRLDFAVGAPEPAYPPTDRSPHEDIAAPSVVPERMTEPGQRLKDEPAFSDAADPVSTQDETPAIEPAPRTDGAGTDGAEATPIAAERAVPPRRRGLMARLRSTFARRSKAQRSSDGARLAGRDGSLAKPASAKAAKRKKRGGGGIVNLLFQLVILFALIGGALIWISANGGIERAGENLAESGMGLFGGSSSSGLTEDRRVGAGQFSGDWTTGFDAGDADAIEPGASVSIETVDYEGDDAVRIASVGAGEAGEVRIPLSDDAIARLDGQRGVIAITVRAAGDETTQMTLRCSFVGGDDCARRRFDVNYETTDFLFDVDFSGGIAADGALILNSDIAGEGRAIDLFQVRVQPVS